MSDEATLRDATAQVDPAAAVPTGQDPAEKPAAAAPTITTVTTGQDPADKDAAELGRLLIESGYSKDRINDLLAAPNALHSIQNMVRNNPQEFLTQLERTDPDAARKFHETMADEYVKRYQPPEPAARATNGAANSELMEEVRALREKVNQSETREQQRETAKAMAATQARYNQRVDELFNNEDIKKMELTPAEKKGMKARLDSELARDPAAVQRLNNGNFFDVPRRFKDIIEEWAGDKKSAAEAAKAQRERANSVSAFDFANGPNPIAGFDPKAVAGGSDEEFEAAFAKALERFA